MQPPSHDRHLLVSAAADAARHAYAPYSAFAVGAALQDTAGGIWTGCNVENSSYGLTICAERNAIFKAIAAGVRQFNAIAIVAPGPTLPMPCGACRQVLQEFCDPETSVWVATQDALSTPSAFSLGDLLPHPFSLHPLDPHTGETP